MKTILSALLATYAAAIRLRLRDQGSDAGSGASGSGPAWVSPADQLFDRLDYDSDGVLTKEDYVTGMLATTFGSQEYWSTVFDEFSNEQGVMDKTDFMTAVAQYQLEEGETDDLVAAELREALAGMNVTDQNVVDAIKSGISSSLEDSGIDAGAAQQTVAGQFEEAQESGASDEQIQAAIQSRIASALAERLSGSNGSDDSAQDSGSGEASATGGQDSSTAQGSASGGQDSSTAQGSASGGQDSSTAQGTVAEPTGNNHVEDSSKE